MKKLLSLVICLLLMVSLALPVLATEAQWEAPPEESAQWDNIPIEKMEGVAAVPEGGDIGALDGEQIITYGSALPPAEATQASSFLPNAFLLIVLAVLLGIALFAGIVILVIALIVRSVRKKPQE